MSGRSEIPFRQRIWAQAAEHFILPVGDRIFGQRMMQHLDFLRQSQYWSHERVAEYRKVRLLELIKTVYHEVPFYREQMDRGGITPRNFQGVADLPKLPIATKNLLRAAYPERLTRDTGQKTYEACSSGSTGAPFCVREDAYTAGIYRAAFLIALEWAGWQIGVPHIQTGITPARPPGRRLKDLMLRCHYGSAYDLRDEQLDTTLDYIDQHIDNPGKIVSTGLNAAIAQAKGSIIVRVDGHCEIAPDYVLRSVAHLGQADIGCVGGPIQTIGKTPFSQTIALAMSSPFGVGDSTFRTGATAETFVDTVAFPAFTRAALDAAGPFDAELIRNQDDEYSYRLRAKGYKILLAPDIRSRYYSRSDLRSLWRQYYQYGYWKVRVMQKHPQQMRPRQFVPPLFVAALCGGAVLSPFVKAIRWLWLLVIMLYGIANGLASVTLAARKGWQHLGSLPVVFFTLHTAYGLGFLVGLVKWFNR